MGKNKLVRFKELATFNNVFEVGIKEVISKDFELKDQWSQRVFKNDHPIILELGCGKGEYTIRLAEMYPNKNFIGIDIKGARIWKGAKISVENKMHNVAFIRTRIEFLNSFFSENSVEEIWVTFPDPFIKETNARRRLTSPNFLKLYEKILKKGGVVHLKTDSWEVYRYTLEMIKTYNLDIIQHSDNLYCSTIVDEVLSVQTFYEQQFMKMGKCIKYIQFVGCNF